MKKPKTEQTDEAQKGRQALQRARDESNRRKAKQTDELRPEYDLTLLLKEGTRGKYAAQYQAGTNVVLLDPDVAAAFPTSASVNEALRLVMKLAVLPVPSSGGNVIG
jgi:hypothetical protein